MEKQYIIFNTGSGCFVGLITFIFANIIGFYALLEIEDTFFRIVSIFAIFALLIWIPFYVDRRQTFKDKEGR